MSQKVRKKIQALEIVKVVDLEPIIIHHGDDSVTLHFRIEVLRELQSKRAYRVRVFRTEMFRIQPTFPMKGSRLLHEPCDEEIFVEDISAEWRKITGTSAKEVLKRVIERIEKMFSVQIVG